MTHCDVAGIDVVIGSWVWLSAKHHSRILVWQTQRERYSKSKFKVTVLEPSPYDARLSLKNNTLNKYQDKSSLHFLEKECI